MKAEEMDRRVEQPVDRDLNIGTHVTGKLPRPGQDLVARHSGKMPIECYKGISELLARQFFRAGPGGEQAVAAQADRLAEEKDIGHGFQ
ncbi:hypothetical protein [Bradyrhizobium embrapense]